MPYPLKDYWETLATELLNFEKLDMKADNKEDEECYQKQKKFLETMLAKGREVESTTWTISKTIPGLALKSLPQETWGDDRVITSSAPPSPKSTTMPPPPPPTPRTK